MMRGMYSGYVIDFQDGQKKMKLDTVNGIRGFDIPVEVSKDANGEYTAYLKGIKLEIASVWECEWKRVK